MNTLKNFSILIVGIIGFSTAVSISYKILSNKNIKSSNDFIVKTAFIFISSSILLNLAFGRISKLYDILDGSSFKFIKIFNISKTSYGISPEMFKMVFLYLGVILCFVFIFSYLSKILTKKIIPEGDNSETLTGIILLSFTLAFYPLIEQILNSFY